MIGRNIRSRSNTFCLLKPLARAESVRTRSTASPYLSSSMGLRLWFGQIRRTPLPFHERSLILLPNRSADFPVRSNVERQEGFRRSLEPWEVRGLLRTGKSTGKSALRWQCPDTPPTRLCAAFSLLGILTNRICGTILPVPHPNADLLAFSLKPLAGRSSNSKPQRGGLFIGKPTRVLSPFFGSSLCLILRLWLPSKPSPT